MPGPWSFLRSWLPVLYLQVTSVAHLKSSPHPKTPHLPPEKRDSQATAGSITMETKDDATTLRLGGSVMKTSFLAAVQAAQQEHDQQEEAKARHKSFRQARHRGTQAQARQTEPVAKRARTSAEASAAPHTNSRPRRAHRNAFVRRS